MGQSASRFTQLDPGDFANLVVPEEIVVAYFAHQPPREELLDTFDGLLIGNTDDEPEHVGLESVADDRRRGERFARGRAKPREAPVNQGLDALGEKAKCRRAGDFPGRNRPGSRLIPGDQPALPHRLERLDDVKWLARGLGKEPIRKRMGSRFYSKSLDDPKRIVGGEWTKPKLGDG